MRASELMTAVARETGSPGGEAGLRGTPSRRTRRIATSTCHEESCGQGRERE